MSMKYKINAAAAALGRRLVRWAERDSNLLRHAKSEWGFAFPGDCEMQKEMGEHVFDMVAMFSAEGHSGGSAPYAIRYIDAALGFKPFSPLTGADNEWGDDFDGEGTRQNKRCGRVFKGPDGRAYDIDGKVFEDGGLCYTSRESRVYVDFPYTPTTEIVKVASNPPRPDEQAEQS